MMVSRDTTTQEIQYWIGPDAHMYRGVIYGERCMARYRRGQVEIYALTPQGVQAGRVTMSYPAMDIIRDYITCPRVQ